MSREKRIDVQPGNYSVLGGEFGNIRDHFDLEMRRVEEEMGRLRREFESYTPRINRSPSPAQLPPGPNRSQPYVNGAAQLSPYGNAQVATSRPRYDPYLEGIKSPLIRDESDGKTLRLRFDVSQYRPEEVTVKTVDNRLLVHARHEEKSPNKTVYREYNQEFMLPRGTDPEVITSSLSTDGILTVTAPLPALDQPPMRGQIAQY